MKKRTFSFIVYSIIGISLMINHAVADSSLRFFLNLDGIEGSSTQPGYERWIEVIDFEHSIETESIGTSDSRERRAGKAKFSGITIIKALDIASVKLIESCTKQTSHPRAELVCIKTGENTHELYRIICDEVIINFYALDADGEHPIPQEQIIFSFRKVEFIYKELTHDGRPGRAVTFEWNVE